MVKLVRRKECWRPTALGWLLVLLLLLAGGLYAVTRIHAFLAPTHAQGRELLVVEGWLSDVSLRHAVSASRHGHYLSVLTSGGPLIFGGALSEYKTFADLAQASLQKMGVDMPVFAVPAPAVRKDRTYASALAVKQWMRVHDPDVRAFDVATAGPHARRSWLLYREAFGPGYDIGIIALPPEDYDANRWWVSSAGVRTVIGEAIAWVYAALFFSPGGAGAQ